MAKETKQNGSRDGEKSIRAWCYLFLLDDDEDDDDDDDGDAALAVLLRIVLPSIAKDV